MLVGQQLGPFAIERELGAGAMGAVYRARYVKTGQVVAVKVMAPGLGDSNPNAVARFEREAAILKQLNHPNIVRLFGVGKYQGTRYYAMEYVVGESLDHVMARRGRMTWEEVVELGQQLCAALQHAHEAGVVHRDLKPSNLMILPDGTLKLTDFGIAKDLDVTALTSANCTVGTASYMSPEQCRGERDITHKSDLYSLGVVFYELITGRKPFNADNAMEMFMLHVQGTFERPSRLVLDLPVWMDNLICQLLEKKPEQRPFDAAMVHNALGAVQEKVEAQRSAGVDAVKARMIDRPRGTRNPDDEDKEVARSLMGGKARAKRKRKGTPFYRHLWFQAVGIVALMGFMAGVLFLVFRPAAPETLYAQAKKLMASSDADKHEEAYEGPIKTYLANYAGNRNELTTQVLSWKKQCEVEQAEQSLQTLIKMHKRFNKEPTSEAEGQAFKATQAEEVGDLDEARRLWQEMTQKYGQTPWGALAANHLAVVEAVPTREKALLDQLKEFRSKGHEPALEGMDKDAYTALRFEHFGDLYGGGGDVASAYHKFDAMKEACAGKPDLHFWEVFAAWKCKELKPNMDATESADARKKLVQGALDAAQDFYDNGRLLDARPIVLSIAALYGDDPDLKTQTDKARAMAKDLAGKLNAP